MQSKKRRKKEKKAFLRKFHQSERGLPGEKRRCIFKKVGVRKKEGGKNNGQRKGPNGATGRGRKETRKREEGEMKRLEKVRKDEKEFLRGASQERSRKGTHEPGEERKDRGGESVLSGTVIGRNVDK